MEINPKHSIMLELKKKAAADKSDKTVDTDVQGEKEKFQELKAEFEHITKLLKEIGIVKQLREFDVQKLKPTTKKGLDLMSKM